MTPQPTASSPPVQRPLAGWDPRLRLLSLFGLAFAISMVQDWQVLGAAVLVAVLAVQLSRIPLSQLLRRLRYPSWIVLAVVLFLPFAAEGEALFPALAGTPTREGLEAALRIAIRAYCILVLAVVVFSSAPVLEHIRGLRGLGLPDLLADLVLLVVRYLEVLGEDLRQMRRSMRLRGDTGHGWRSLGRWFWLVGSLLLRSHDRSARVYAAMRLRGHGRSFAPAPAPLRAGRLDYGGAAVAIGLALGLVLMEWLA
jgi:cobalt/nickel transport system permease protein